MSACFGSLSEATLWIKEVEMVDSVDDVKTSQSIAQQTHRPNFELLDARCASSLNKVIQISLEEQKKAQKEDCFLC